MGSEPHHVGNKVKWKRKILILENLFDVDVQSRTKMSWRLNDT